MGTAVEVRKKLQRCRSALQAHTTYELADRVLRLVFEGNPTNTNDADVLRKVVLLNALYATSIYDVFRMAHHVHRLGAKLDAWIATGSPQAVSRVRRGHGIRTSSGVDRDFYSFATKYASWHRPEVYPMYDKYVATAIRRIRRWLGMPSLSAGELRRFRRFRRALDELHDAVEWPTPGYKEFDQGLWVLGQVISGEADREIRAVVGKPRL